MHAPSFFIFNALVYSTLAIPDQYIIKFKEGVDKRPLIDFFLSKSLGPKGEKLGSLKHEFGSKFFNGFAGEIKPSFLNLLKKLQGNFIDYIEEEQIYTTTIAMSTQNNPPNWGLSRICRKAADPFTGNYDHPTSGGAGVTAYVIDTGIYVNSAEFDNNRILPGSSMLTTKSVLDKIGHGTHCSGVIGSKSFGVAKKVLIYPVKVVNDKGAATTSDIIEGIEKVLSIATRGKSVINISLGGPLSSALNAAVDSAFEQGIPVIVAAGNSASTTCTTSPASASGALTVGAIDSADRRASFSNYGDCVDVFAPGVNIPSTWINLSTKVLSGTSMAAPFVTGVVCLFLSEMSFPNTQGLYDFVKNSADLLEPGFRILYNYKKNFASM